MSLIYGYSDPKESSNELVEANRNDISKLVAGTVGQVKTNKESIKDINNFVGSVSSFEGESNLKGTQLSHASAITAHSNNLLELEDLLGTKTDSETVDTAFGRIKKNSTLVSIKETMGSFVAPLNNGKVEITGKSMPDSSTLIAVVLKANAGLSGVSRATIYSSDIFYNSKHAMTSPMSLSNMKVGRAAIMFMGRGPGHSKIFANVIGNAVGSVAVRTISVRFVYIDHSGSV